MPQELSRKIRIAFIIQVVLASVAIMTAGYLVAAVSKFSLVSSALHEEAAHFWQLYHAAPPHPPPNTFNLRGYLVLRGQSDLLLPEKLRPLAPGFHELKQEDLLVLVDEQPAGRLYLVFLRSQAEKLALLFGALPIMLTLIALYMV
ncbi:MAG: sensor histidine kinase, partial [Pseudoxanthomonas sp.]|nr:sensor histidine kinase [Pseudoxanthomonas sp.]